MNGYVSAIVYDHVSCVEVPDRVVEQNGSKINERSRIKYVK